MPIEVHLAHVLGTNAILAFAAMLAVLLAVILVFSLVLGRIEHNRGPGPLPPNRLLILRLVVGFAVVVAASFGFAEMAEALDVSESMGRFDVALADTLRLQLPVTALHAFAQVTQLGDVSTLTVLCVAVVRLLLWAKQHTLALAWLLAVAGNGALTHVLKDVFERVRPVHEHGLLVGEGWSFPSGHSSGAVVAYGMLAYVVIRSVSAPWRLPVLLLAATLAFTTGFSRVFLQVHYASDVLAGFASGLLWLTVCVISSEWLRLRAASPA